MSVKKSLDDESYCKSIAESISEIIRFSLNEDFRKKCFAMFEVTNTKDTEREIKERLMFLLQNKTEVLISQCKNTSTQTAIENKESSSDTQSNTDTIPTPSTSTGSNSQPTSQNIFIRNWLKISSQQHREVIKRKKLSYYSQPQLDERLQRETEFNRWRVYSTDSQQSSNSSLFSDERISLSQPLNDSANYCKEKFKDTFRENAQKYFRENFKSHKIGSPQCNEKFSN